MTVENTQVVAEEIRELLSHYEDGWDIFKNAKDWDVPVKIKDGFEDANIPQTWMELADRVISIIAHKKYGLDTYANTIEIITADQMLDLYTSVGIPVTYSHWSIGKSRISQGQAYQKRQMGLAFEIVINTNPAIAYCMETNSPTMQMLVIAHASYGHNSFFKGNHLFRQFTDADNLIEQQRHLAGFISECEDQYGEEIVEKLLDACHALQTHGVYRYKKPKPRSKEEQEARRKRLEEIRQENVDVIMDSVCLKPKFSETANLDRDANVLADMEENLLQYVASDAPHLKPWQRQIIQGISEKAQYFYPQGQTKLMNEGWASFWHYQIMRDMEALQLISSGQSIEFFESHSAVLFQPGFDDERYSGINPYALGFAMFQDIRRICLEPTDEDREWFPRFAGNPDWLPVLKAAMINYKDESFVEQFLSPKVARDFGLFSLRVAAGKDYYEVREIHNQEGFRALRQKLASQYRMADEQPRIEVMRYNVRGDRSLTLKHTMHNDRPLDEVSMLEVLKHLHQLWGHRVKMESYNTEGTLISRLSCPEVTDEADQDYKTGYDLIN